MSTLSKVNLAGRLLDASKYVEPVHYNQIFRQFWFDRNIKTVFQPSCLQIPFDPDKGWPIAYPEVEWDDNTIVIMHTQDFVSIIDGVCPELVEIEQHFGDRADQVIVIHWNIDLETIYDGPMHLIYFPTHSYELLNNLRENREEWEPNFSKPRQHSWQCLNGIPRFHRKLVADHLQKNYKKGILSLAEEIPLPEWSYNTYFGCENETNWMRLQPVYTDCCTNIVTETMYYDRPGIITEKTLFAFLAMQFPILIGYAGIIDHCESLGFDMFRDVVDTSYDYADNHERWKMALNLNRDLLTGTETYYDRATQHKLHKRLKKNREHALIHFPQLMLSSYTTRCKEIWDNHPKL